MLILHTILAVFAAYRIAAMVARERGPSDLFVTIRSWVHGRWGERSWQGEGINCPLCVSFWAALPLALVITPDPWLWPLWWLGIAGAAAALFVWEPR